MVKKIALFAVWMAVLSVFVYNMAYAGGDAECGPKMADKCEMKGDKDCSGTKFNFVPGNRNN